MLDIVHSNDAAQIRQRIAQGYEPVECSIDGESLVGALELDHHGPRSHLESVALRAYRDHFGARSADPRFVVTGRADADATFAIAALARLLPTPSDQDLLSLAELIHKVDLDPLAVDLSQREWGEALLLFHALSGSSEGAPSFQFGVYLWRQLVTCPPRPLLDHAASLEQERRIQARAAETLIEQGQLLLLRSAVWGFDVWYGRRSPDADPKLAASWEHPLVLVHDSKSGAATLGCPNPAVARELFGPSGLLEVLPRLQPPGWGGRPSIGGSPRGQSLTEPQVREAGEVLLGFLEESSC